MTDFDSHTSMFSTIEPLSPIRWDSPIGQQMIDSYSQIYQLPQDLYSNIYPSTTTSPSSDGSSHLDESIRTLDSNARIRGTNINRVKKRREQNRLSQRAYRDRKEKYQRELEEQLFVWKQKHEELVKSHASQTEEVSELKAQIEALHTRVMLLQSGLPDIWGHIDQFPHDFDLIPVRTKS